MLTRIAIASALLASASLALANGRPPATNGVFFSPSDPSSLYVRSTFGLLISRDDGCSFRWVCEDAIGYAGEYDPKYAIAGDGTIFATTFTGLSVSRDGGCNWSKVIPETWIDALDIGPDGRVWAATADSGKPNDVFVSTNNGVSFTGTGLSSPTLWWKSVKVAPSNAQRVYVTGYQVAPQTAAALRRSNDGGASWTDVPLAGVMFGATPLVYVVAVDKAQPDHFLLTSLAASPPNGDRLYETTDGGATFTEVLVTSEQLRNVVLRADGSVIAATLGAGTRVRAAGATEFLPVAAPVENGPDAVPPHFGCLGERSDGTLVGCGANWQPDYMAVGRGAEPVGMQKIFRFVELAGPLACPAGSTVASSCEPMWSALQQQFGATGPTATCAAPPDAGPPPALPKAEPAGCCDTSTAAAPGALLLAGGVGFLLSRRRKKHCCS